MEKVQLQCDRKEKIFWQITLFLSFLPQKVLFDFDKIFQKKYSNISLSIYEKPAAQTNCTWNIKGAKETETISGELTYPDRGGNPAKKS